MPEQRAPEEPGGEAGADNSGRAGGRRRSRELWRGGGGTPGHLNPEVSHAIWSSWLLSASLPCDPDNDHNEL